MELKKSFGQELLGKIKEKKLVPKPKWQFFLKDYMVWGSGVAALFVGGLAFSVIIYMFINNDWGVYEHFSGSLLGFVLLSLPYFWILLLVLFIAIVNYNIKHTKNGYRYPIGVIAAASIVVSAGIGLIFFGAGMSQAVDEILGENLPLYEKFINSRIGQWEHPGEGLLAGLVTERISTSSIIVFGLDRKEWTVDLSGARIAPGVEITVGQPLKFTGEAVSDNVFRAGEVLPAGPGGGFLRRNNRMHFIGPEGGVRNRINPGLPGRLPMMEGRPILPGLPRGIGSSTDSGNI